MLLIAVLFFILLIVFTLKVSGGGEEDEMEVQNIKGFIDSKEKIDIYAPKLHVHEVRSAADIAEYNKLLEMAEGFVYDTKITEKSLVKGRYFLGMMGEPEMAVCGTALKMVKWGYDRPVLMISNTITHRGHRLQGYSYAIHMALIDHLRSNTKINKLHVAVAKDNTANTASIKKMGFKHEKDLENDGFYVLDIHPKDVRTKDIVK